MYGPVGEMAKSMATSNGLSLDVAYSISDATAEPLGDNTYTVLLFSPVLSMLW